MSWLKSAFSKAAEAGGKNLGPNLTKTVKNYAGSVYQQAGQAVAGGAKIMQDRLSGRNLNNFKHAVRRLDEVALNARGEERKQALARWLNALKDIDKEVKHSIRRTDDSGSPKTHLEDDPALSPRRASMVLFFDADTGGEPLNFRDVFLRSHAVENIVTSLIIEAPSEEEISMLLETFGLCLAGGEKLHHGIISSIQELAMAASGYEDEVLIKKEELLQMVRDAVGGLKLNPEVERLDAEIILLQDLILEKEGILHMKSESVRMQPSTPALEPNTTADIIQLQVRLCQCLQKKSSAIRSGNSPNDHALKVQRLKELIVRLNNSSQEFQKQLLENRQQKQEAINYRITKAQEVAEVEKVVAEEVRELDRRRQELEAELQEVKAALAAATSRHIHTQEEKEQFDEASSNIFAHLSIKEEELSHSITAQTAEESVVNTWVNFLEDSWLLQSGFFETTLKDMEITWEESKQQFFQIAAINLAYSQESVDFLLKRLKSCAEELETLRQKRANVAEEGMIPNIQKAMRKAQTSYLDTELQVEKIFKGTAQLEEEVQVYLSGQDEQKSEMEGKLLLAFEAMARLRNEFSTQSRPEIEAEKTENKAIQQGRAIFVKAKAQVIETGDKLRAVTSKHDSSRDQSVEAGAQDEKISPGDGKISSQIKDEDTDSPESEDSHDLGVVDDLPQAETEGWEFDELEEEVISESMAK